VTRLPGTPADDQSRRGDVDRDELLATLVDAAPVGAWVTTTDGTFEHVNPACSRLWGYEPTELVGQHFTVVVPPESRIRLRAVHDRLIAGGGQVREEWELLAQDRSRHRVAANACRVLGGDGQYRKVTFVVDVSEQDRLAGALAQADAELAEANLRLAHLAAHDSLTGLPDHRRSHELLVQAMEIAERYGRDLAVAVVDLDRFKVINDTFGHMEGDQVLIEFARQVQNQLRAVDAVGRLGGEEFLVVLPETTAAGAVVVLDRVRTACWDHLHTPDGRPVEFNAGVVGFVAHEIPQMLLRRADAALARAKDAGRNRTELA
jgi:diguanylate cyclase (GGDEF)-like protein/PAS domain S-box-containing protein